MLRLGAFMNFSIKSNITEAFSVLKVNFTGIYQQQQDEPSG